MRVILRRMIAALVRERRMRRVRERRMVGVIVAWFNSGYISERVEM